MTNNDGGVVSRVQSTSNPQSDAASSWVATSSAPTAAATGTPVPIVSSSGTRLPIVSSSAAAGGGGVPVRIVSPSTGIHGTSGPMVTPGAPVRIIPPSSNLTGTPVPIVAPGQPVPIVSTTTTLTPGQPVPIVSASFSHNHYQAPILYPIAPTPPSAEQAPSQSTRNDSSSVTPMELPDPPETTTTPTARDRAYTYVMLLSVTKVRDMCRNAGLKQFGKKAESQPRLFWGAESQVPEAGDTNIESWYAVLDGLREWLVSPQRTHSTLWRVAPSRNARPPDIHTYYAMPGSMVGRTRGAIPNCAVDSEEDDVVSLGAGETPTERDKLYTYTRSLSITFVRKTCKRLGLKQFGRKRESQTRLFWHITSNDYTPLCAADGTSLCDPRGDAIRWASTAAPERWFRAPVEDTRPTADGRMRDRAIQRRKKFAAHELARLVSALASTPEMRSRAATTLSNRRTDPSAESIFWGTCVAPVFNDAAFVPRMPPAVREHPTSIEARGGEELRRHFERACPAFVRTYKRWHNDGAQHGRFEAYLRERRRSDAGAPLSPTEKRASVVFSALNCGEPNQATELLHAILEYTDENAEFRHDDQPDTPMPMEIVQSDLGQHGPPTIHLAPIAPATSQPSAPQQSPQHPSVPADEVEPEPIADDSYSEPTTVTVPSASVSAVPAAGATTALAVDQAAGNSILGKRTLPPTPPGINALWEEVRALQKTVEEALVPAAKTQRAVQRAQHEKELYQAIASARQFMKEQLDTSDDASNSMQRLRAANAATIDRLTRDIERLAEQDDV